MPEPVYVPILKGKEGEYAAMEALAAEIKSQLMPLVEVPEVPYDYANEAPAKSLDEHIMAIPARLQRAFAQTPFYLDLAWLGNEEALSTGQAALEVLLSKSEAFGLLAVPVVRRDSSPETLAAAKAHAVATENGVCIRLLVSDFEDDVDLEFEVNRLRSQASSDNRLTDLILDLGDLGSNVGTATLVARSMLSMVPAPDEWRRIVFAAASFPEDLSEVGAATIVNLPRLEWDLWKTLQKRPGSLPRRDLIFGDYTMAHPVIKALDPRTMRMSANIRYTTDDNWLVIKGRNVRQYGFSQYFELCRKLIANPAYKGRHFSWGDAFISDCAEAMKQGPGNATTWRKVGVNHHITLVTKQLATLRGVA